MSPVVTRTASRTAVTLALVAGLGLTAGCGTAAREGAGGTDSPSAGVASGEPTRAASTPERTTTPAPTRDVTGTSPGAGTTAAPTTRSSTARTTPPTAMATAWSAEPTSTSTRPTDHSRPAAPLPGDAVSYADALVRAWGAGRHADAARYATPRALRQLFDHADPGGAHWDRVGRQGAAGTIYVSYRDTVTGDRVTLAVGNIAVGEHQEHAVREVHFV